jgi:hypothetical protein
LPQGGAAIASVEKNYLNSVFNSKTAKAVPTHEDFSAAIAKDVQNGILKVRPLCNATPC